MSARRNPRPCWKGNRHAQSGSNPDPPKPEKDKAMNIHDLIEKLQELLYLARTGLPPAGISDEAWCKYNLIKIEAELQELIAQKLNGGL